MNKPISLLCLICILPLLSAAQEAPGRWSFGLYSQQGFTLSNTAYPSDHILTNTERFFGLAGGIRGRGGVAPKFAMGLGLGYAQSWRGEATVLSGTPDNRFQLSDREVPIAFYIPLGNTEKNFSLLQTPEAVGGQLLARPHQPAGNKWLFGPGIHTNVMQSGLINQFDRPGYTLGGQTIYVLPSRKK